MSFSKLSYLMSLRGWCEEHLWKKNNFCIAKLHSSKRNFFFACATRTSQQPFLKPVFFINFKTLFCCCRRCLLSSNEKEATKEWVKNVNLDNFLSPFLWMTCFELTRVNFLLSMETIDYPTLQRIMEQCPHLDVKSFMAVGFGALRVDEKWGFSEEARRGVTAWNYVR